MIHFKKLTKEQEGQVTDLQQQIAVLDAEIQDLDAQRIQVVNNYINQINELQTKRDEVFNQLKNIRKPTYGE